MGASGSRMKRLASTFLSSGNNNNDYDDQDDDDVESSTVRRGRGKAGDSTFWGLHSPLVFRRKGSMYIDEDGDIAHEFYVEVPSTNAEDHKTIMKRITTNLKPQGTVAHEFPRINVNLPVILCES